MSEKTNQMNQNITNYALRILKEIGIDPGENYIKNSPVNNILETEEFELHGVKISVTITEFVNTLRGLIDECKVEIDFSLPRDGALAETFMNHCAAIEKIPKNQGDHYSYGPRYHSYSAELEGKHTYAISPWHNTYFVVESINYRHAELEEAVNNAIALARQFTAHLSDLSSIRYWKPTDKEVITKAKEIVKNASFQETDCDRKAGAHWLRDRNSFFKGWFYPFNNRGNGTFDTMFQPYYAAIGIEGSFEYAVSCLLLYDEEYIRKAREACVIRK